MNAQENIVIDDLLALARSEKPLSVPESWTQGRTVYGGLSSALLLEALIQKVDTHKQLRALNIGFSAPTLPNELFGIETELLRQGKTIEQWQARLIQNGQVCVLAHAVFGMPLESELSIPCDSLPEIPAVEGALEFPSENAPGFIQHYQMAQSQGDLPLSGGNSMELGGWMRLRKAPEHVSASHLVSMIDVWPPATMMRLKEMKAGSTVSWTMQFPQPMPAISGEEYLGYQTRIEQSEGGYAITHAKVWNQNRELVALSQQTVIVYG